MYKKSMITRIATVVLSMGLGVGASMANVVAGWDFNDVQTPTPPSEWTTVSASTLTTGSTISNITVKLTGGALVAQNKATINANAVFVEDGTPMLSLSQQVYEDYFRVKTAGATTAVPEFTISGLTPGQEYAIQWIGTFSHTSERQITVKQDGSVVSPIKATGLSTQYDVVYSTHYSFTATNGNTDVEFAFNGANGGNADTYGISGLAISLIDSPTEITFVMTNGVPALTGTAAGQASTSITNSNVEVDGELYDVVLNVSGYTDTTGSNDGNIRTPGGVAAGSLAVVGGTSVNALDIGEGANVDIVVLKAGEEFNASFDITEFMIKGNNASRDYSITDAAGDTSGAQGAELVSPTSFTASSGASVPVVMEPEAFNVGSSTDFAWNRPSGGTPAMGLYSISMFISDVTTGIPPAQIEFSLLDGIPDAITNEAGIASHSITQANMVVDGQAYDVIFSYSGYTAAPTNGVAGLGNLALGYGPFSLNLNSNDTTGGIGVIGLERGTIGRDYTFNSNPWDEGLNIDITVLSNGVEMAADFSLVEFKIVEGFPDTTRDYALFDEAGTTATNGGAQGGIIHQASNIEPDINGAVAVSMPDITSKVGIDFAWNRNNYGGGSIGNAMSMKSMTFQINSVTDFTPEEFTSNGTPYSWLDSFPGLVVGGDYEAADAGDQDGDGILTWQEYKTGTDPQDPASIFSFTASESGSVAGDFIITWTSGEGSLFTLSSNINLSVDAWGVVASNIVGQVNETSYTTTAGSAATFFDVELQ